MLVVGVAISLSLVNTAVEYSDAVPIQYRNVALLELRQVVEVNAPVRVPEEAVAFANAAAGALPLLLGGVVADTAPLAVVN